MSNIPIDINTRATIALGATFSRVIEAIKELARELGRLTPYNLSRLQAILDIENKKVVWESYKLTLVSYNSYLLKRILFFNPEILSK